MKSGRIISFFYLKIEEFTTEGMHACMITAVVCFLFFLEAFLEPSSRLCDIRHETCRKEPAIPEFYWILGACDGYHIFLASIYLEAESETSEKDTLPVETQNTACDWM